MNELDRIKKIEKVIGTLITWLHPNVLSKQNIIVLLDMLHNIEESKEDLSDKR